MSKKQFRNYAFVLEGENPEQEIIKEVFKQYGFNVAECGKIDKDCSIEELTKDKLVDNNHNIVIFQGHKNRISELLTDYQKNVFRFETAFSTKSTYYAGIFIIYDVDHASKQSLQELFNIYQEPTNGLLLVSSPSIEVLADQEERLEFCTLHVREYKKEVRRTFIDDNNQNTNPSIKTVKSNVCTAQYIIDNFEDFVIKYIKKNCADSGLTDVLLHPEFVVNKINKLNLRTTLAKNIEPVEYRYFTTVIYVCFAYIFKIDKYENNAQKLIEFFEQQKERLKK